jgi:hypothetical protein
MDRARHTEKQPERRTSKSTAKAGPRPWEVSPYIHQESSRDDKRSSHGDPRLEFTLQGHGQHQDSCSVPSDGDPKYIHSAFFGSGATPDLYARDELGTLAGSSRKEEQEQIMMIMRRMTTPDSNKKLEAEQRKIKQYSQSEGGLSGEVWKKEYEMIVKAQQEYKKRAENLRKNYR